MFYAHPFELALGFVMVISGIRAFISGESSPSINDALPEELLLAFQIISFLAGVCLLAGLALRSNAFGRTIERVGTILAAGTYGGYAAILAFTVPLWLAWSTLSTTAAVALAFWLRGKAIRKTELTILRALRAGNVTEDPHELMRRLMDSRGLDLNGQDRRA